ncbi:hypothetical protein ACFQDN_25520 [Pseudomonas asuensis]|jgi:hypothetical protein|uniref:Uncharacterized protein n=1 Tax=Pseudomonas asuensis TaxID=1825787 RepID=A0ABQ2GWP5_9PSED|nr:hypothetical protein [Pseudomonas asuensis]GGM17534.1 hypothetical protein GCM10009425_30610 [Pseudomonas asuensis]
MTHQLFRNPANALHTPISFAEKAAFLLGTQKKAQLETVSGNVTHTH